MSDEPKSDKPDDGWVMPEPVYRSSPGRTPQSTPQTASADDITTQPGFTDEDNIDTLAPDFVDTDDVPTEKPVKVKPAEPKPKKKRGCLWWFLFIVGIIVLAIVAYFTLVVWIFSRYFGSESSGF